KVARLLYRVMWPWGLLAWGIGFASAKKGSPLYNFLAAGVVVMLGGYVLLLLLGCLFFVLRVMASLFGLGEWSCARNWHWWREFPIHTHVGLGSRTTTYL